jgi:hypothetical protein
MLLKVGLGLSLVSFLVVGLLLFLGHAGAAAIFVNDLFFVLLAVVIYGFTKAKN